MHNHPTPSVQSICGTYIHIFTRHTIRNQHDIIKTAVADVSKGQTDMSHKGELQTLTKLSMRHQVNINLYCYLQLKSIDVMIHFHMYIQLELIYNCKYRCTCTYNMYNGSQSILSYNIVHIMRNHSLAVYYLVMVLLHLFSFKWFILISIAMDYFFIIKLVVTLACKIFNIQHTRSIKPLPPQRRYYMTDNQCDYMEIYSINYHRIKTKPSEWVDLD